MTTDIDRRRFLAALASLATAWPPPLRAQDRRRWDVACFYYPSWHPSAFVARMRHQPGWTEWQVLEQAHPKAPDDPQPRHPSPGPYDDADPRVVEHEIALARGAGISCFVFDWYFNNGRAFYQAPISDGFLGARNAGQIGFMMLWANHDVPALDWHFDYAGYDFDAMGAALARYVQHPNYFRIDGRPAFGVFLIKPMLAVLGPDGVRRGFAALRARVAAAGLGDLYILACEEHVSGMKVLGIDGATSYQTMNAFGPGRIQYAAAMARSTQIWQLKAHDLDVPYFPDCSVGWDNSPRLPDGAALSYVVGRSPGQFAALLRAAKAFVAGHDLPPLLFVSSWNEWTEDHYVLPDRDFGTGYLDAIRTAFGPG